MNGTSADGPDANPEAVARRIALSRLNRAPRTRSELEETLATRGVPAEASTKVLDRFTEVGLIDDAAFARAWVQSRQAGRGLARRALAQELRRRGVDGDVLAEALDQVDDADEEATARKLVERRLASTARLDRVTRIRRLTGVLARKGYPPGLAMRVVCQALDEDRRAQDR